MFETKLTTLTSVSDSRLARMFQSDSMGNSAVTPCLHCMVGHENNYKTPCHHPDTGLVVLDPDSGVYNVDIDPDCFASVLVYLRHRLVSISPGTSPLLVASVADQLGLHDLAKTIRNSGDGGKKASMTDWLKLNVGGTIFETSRATLTSHPSSSLAKMFAPNSSLTPATMEDGVYLLDACPRAFSVILNWLRYRKLMLDGIMPGEIGPVADYFGLGDLNQALHSRVKKNEAKERGLAETLDGLTERLEDALQQIQSEMNGCVDKLDDIKIEVAGVATGLEDLWRIKCEVATIAASHK